MALDVPLLVATRCLSMIASIALSTRNLPFLKNQVIFSKQQTVMHLTFVGVRAAVQMTRRDFKVSRLRKMNIDTAFAILCLGVTPASFIVDKPFFLCHCFPKVEPSKSNQADNRAIDEITRK
jgi:hypothetical protein